MKRTMKSQAHTNAPPRRKSYRPRLEVLEDRLQPGDTVLGEMLGFSLLESNLAVLNSSAVTPENDITNALTATDQLTPPNFLSSQEGDGALTSSLSLLPGGKSKDRCDDSGEFLSPGFADGSTSVLANTNAVQVLQEFIDPLSELFAFQTARPAKRSGLISGLGAGQALPILSGQGDPSPVWGSSGLAGSWGLPRQSDETTAAAQPFEPAILQALAPPTAQAADAPAVPTTSEVDRARVREDYSQLPLRFEVNRGQTDAQVQFLARGSGSTLFLTAGEAVLRFQQPAPANATAPETVLRMQFLGAKATPQLVGREELPGKVNYFYGDDPAQWHTNVPTYAGVEYREIYAGINLVYYSHQQQLEYDFVVAPGANPNAIALRFTGADRVGLDAQGDLVLDSAGASVRQHKPFVYQEVNGAKQEIASSYVLQSAQQVGFHVAAYDSKRPLVIDPVISYSTYLGGSGADAATGIALDGAGNAYITGNTASIDFPIAGMPFEPESPGPYSTSHAFVAKLTPSGSGPSDLIYSTYLGGHGYDYAFGISVDADGNAYVTGKTRALHLPECDPLLGWTFNDFPTTPDSYKPLWGDVSYPPNCGLGIAKAFASKLNPDGSALLYSTYFGGNLSDSEVDAGYGIAVVPGTPGEFYMTGFASSVTPSGFPITIGPAYPGGSHPFLARLDSPLPGVAGLVYSKYLDDPPSFGAGYGVAVDSEGNAYVTGESDFKAFVTKVGPTGSSIYFKFLRDSSGNLDVGQAIAVDATGHAYVTGFTTAPDFPVTDGAVDFHHPHDPGHHGFYHEAFVTKLNPAGTDLDYSTYLGCGDEGTGIDVDLAGNIYVTGFTGEMFFPLWNAFQPLYGGGPHDAFVTKINPNSPPPPHLVWSSFLGGSQDDVGMALAVIRATGVVYVAGATTWDGSPSGFPITPGAFQTSHGAGTSSAFVTVIVG
jgi:hypothetical protein